MGSKIFGFFTSKNIPPSSQIYGRKKIQKNEFLYGDSHTPITGSTGSTKQETKLRRGNVSCVYSTDHPTITTFQYISHLVCRIDMLKSRKSEQVHGTRKDTSPWYKSIEIKYAHMIAKGSAAKHTLGAPR